MVGRDEISLGFGEHQEGKVNLKERVEVKKQKESGS